MKRLRTEAQYLSFGQRLRKCHESGHEVRKSTDHQLKRKFLRSNLTAYDQKIALIKDILQTAIINEDVGFFSSKEGTCCG